MAFLSQYFRSTNVLFNGGSEMKFHFKKIRTIIFYCFFFLKKIGSGYALICALMALIFILPAHAIRLKDIVSIQGVRDNQLVGYGLVVGLDGTGDGKKSLFTVQSMASMLEKMGITIDAKDISVKNVAAVMLTAELPPFAKIGSRVDVLVSSVGDAKNLQGGTLLFTPLKAADGEIYAIAQGPVSTGGFSAEGAGGSVKKNFPTVGRLIGGASIEKELQMQLNQKNVLSLMLNYPDFTTASRVSSAINESLSRGVASTLDAGTVQLKVPERYAGRIVEFMSRIESIEITPDQTSKVVINERTGTVVMGENVRISKVAIAHGNLSIQIKESTEVSQPMPFSDGKTVATPQTDISVDEERNPIVLMEAGVSIGDVVRALNALGVSPRDLIAIMQALKAAGALQAKLEIL
jgi:flagellar P-ring protein FlgI